MPKNCSLILWRRLCATFKTIRLGHHKTIGLSGSTFGGLLVMKVTTFEPHQTGGLLKENHGQISAKIKSDCDFGVVLRSKKV